MSKNYTKDEVLENGYHQISIYDVDSHSLLSTYQTTPDGKKDGEEIEYDKGDIKRRTNWKDGKKNGEEIEYFKGSKDIKRTTNWKDGQKDGLEKIYTNDFIFYRGKELRISAENEYKDGVLTKNREYFYALEKLDSILAFLGKSVSERGLSLSRTQYGTYYSYINEVEADVIKENGEFKHITMKKGHYETFYDMEFKDSKEYDGYFDFTDESGRLFNKGEIRNGKLTGKKLVSLKDSPCAKYISSGTRLCDIKCWQTLKDDELVSHDAYYHWSDGYDGWNYDIHIPVNGQAYKRERQDGLIWKFYTKDGKEDGEYHVGSIHTYYKDGKLNGSYEDFRDKIRKNYKDDVLDGPYTEFFDKIDGKKKVEGFYKEGKKDGVWKYRAEDGTIINQEYWHEGKDCTAKYNRLKKIASKHIEEEDKLSEGKNERVVLKRKTKLGKMIDFAKETVKDR